MPSVAKLIALLSLSMLGATATATDYLECETELVSYEVDQPYSEDAGGTHSDYFAPVATFEVLTPAEFAGRTVQVIFLSTAYDGLQAELKNGIGRTFKLELPDDYFDYPDGAIIKGFLLQSISANR